MSPRLTLTFFWLAGLVTSLIVVEIYMHAESNGVPLVFDDYRPVLLRPVATLYGTILAGILGSWFIKRFKAPTADPDGRRLFTIALVCTLIWNLGVIYLLSQRLFTTGGGGTVDSDFAVATQFGTWFAFLVAPVNFYYFGIKPVGEA